MAARNPSSILPLTQPIQQHLESTCVYVVYVYIGPPQQYPGQEDYYGDQYSHAGQGASEGRRFLQSVGENQ